MPKKILLADDHALVRDTLAQYLGRAGGLAVLQASTLDEALQINAAEGPFGLVLLDYTMPGMNALEGLSRMLARSGCPVALLSGTAPPDVARRALRKGAAGFLPKTLSPEQMLEAVHRMMAGKSFLPMDFLVSEDPNAKVQLTPRETEVLRGLAEGKSNKEIARDLDIQEVTVKLHVKSLTRKLEARNRTHAAMLARDMGLV